MTRINSLWRHKGKKCHILKLVPRAWKAFLENFMRIHCKSKCSAPWKRKTFERKLNISWFTHRWLVPQKCENIQLIFSLIAIKLKINWTFSHFCCTNHLCLNHEILSFLSKFCLSQGAEHLDLQRMRVQSSRNAFQAHGTNFKIGTFLPLWYHIK